MLVKVLGAIDILAGIALLMQVFGIGIILQFVLFCAGLLLMKGLFIITGDVLSIIDLFSSAILIISIFFPIPTFLLWTGAFLLFAKGFVSFL